MPPDLDDAFRARMAEIAAMGLEDAARGAGELTAALGRMCTEAALVRTAAARRLRDAEGLSLADLAGRLGVKRATAQKLLEREKRKRRRRGPAD